MKKSTNTSVNIHKGQVFPVTIKRLGINGEGVGYFKKQVVFVPNALPGEEVVVEATNIHNHFAEGRIKKIRKKSPHRVNPHAQFTKIAEVVSFSTWRIANNLSKNGISLFKHWNAIRNWTLKNLIYGRQSGWMTHGFIETNPNSSLVKLKEIT